MEWQKTAELVKENSRRSVYKVDGNGLGLFIKSDHPTNPRDLLKQLWRNKSQCEFNVGLALAEAGIPVVDMLAWGKNGRNSYLVSKALKDAISFQDAWEYCNDHQMRDAFLLSLANLLRKMVASNINHPDMHSGNIMSRVDGGQQKVDFFLLDLYDIKILTGIYPTQVSRLINWLCFRFDNDFTPQETSLLMGRIFPQHSADEKDNILRAQKSFNTRRLLRKWRGRRSRLLRDSSQCNQQHTEHGMWHLLKQFDLKTAERAVDLHRQQISTPEKLLKAEGKRKVSRVNIDSCTYIVKEFSNPGFYGCWRSDCLSWLNTQRIGYYAIPAATCYAWLKSSDGKGYLILEDVGTENARNFFARHDSTQRAPYIRKIARVLAMLHNKHVFHKDCKVSNFVISDSGDERLTLIDTDRIRFFRSIPDKKRFQNLHQAYSNFPECMRDEEFDLFIAAYCDAFSDSEMSKADTKKAVCQMTA